MILLHSILAFFHTVPGKVLGVGTVVMDAILALLAVEGGTSNNTLIVISIFSNVTVLIGVVVAGWFQRESARIGAARFEMLKPLVELPAKVTELAKGIDGVSERLQKAQEAGAVARVDAADAKGQLKEREAEVARQGAKALAQQEATPTPVIVENTPDEAIVKQAK